MVVTLESLAQSFRTNLADLHCTDSNFNIATSLWVRCPNGTLGQHELMFLCKSILFARVVPIDVWYSCKYLLSSGDLIFCFAIPQGTCKKAEACRAGSHYLHKLNDLNAEKHPRPAVTWTSSNVQSRHVLQEPHTNRNGIFLSILPYLHIGDFSWFRRFVVFNILSVYISKHHLHTI